MYRVLRVLHPKKLKQSRFQRLNHKEAKTVQKHNGPHLLALGPDLDHMSKVLFFSDFSKS